MSDEESDELIALRHAVQSLANAAEDRACVVTTSVVVYEAAYFDDDGDQMQVVRYSCPSDGLSITAALGLLDAGSHLVRRDTLGWDSDD